MDLIPESDNLDDYLVSTDLIDADHPKIQRLAASLEEDSWDEVELARNTYEYVRDEVSHSFDIEGQRVTCRASDVLEYQEGICYAKAHLLAALLRANGIPAGFCYQVLPADDEAYPNGVLHGLNALYLGTVGRWVRLDARGNRPGVDAAFALDEEKLAFPISSGSGGKDCPEVYAEPPSVVVTVLSTIRSVDELRDRLPEDL